MSGGGEWSDRGGLGGRKLIAADRSGRSDAGAARALPDKLLLLRPTRESGVATFLGAVLEAVLRACTTTVERLETAEVRDCVFMRAAMFAGKVRSGARAGL